VGLFGSAQGLLVGFAEFGGLGFDGFSFGLDCLALANDRVCFCRNQTNLGSHLLLGLEKFIVDLDGLLGLELAQDDERWRC